MGYLTSSVGFSCSSKKQEKLSKNSTNLTITITPTTHAAAAATTPTTGYAFPTAFRLNYIILVFIEHLEFFL